MTACASAVLALRAHMRHELAMRYLALCLFALAGCASLPELEGDSTALSYSRLVPLGDLLTEPATLATPQAQVTVAGRENALRHRAARLRGLQPMRPATSAQLARLRQRAAALRDG